MTSFIRQLRLLLLGLWLGAAIFFGAAVAPALFDVLRGAGLENANELAGSIVTRLLAFINRSGFEIGLFIFVTAFFVNRARSRLAQIAEMISVAIMAIMTGVNHWIIAARMAALRGSMGSIDKIAPADARRLEFDYLHRYSVAAMGLAIVAGLVAFLVASRGTSPSGRIRH
jgi:Domain of unknown function (DUF4149)